MMLNEFIITGMENFVNADKEKAIKDKEKNGENFNKK